MASTEWDIFIAHAGSDIQLAENLYELLEGRCRPFLDRRCLQLGDDWDRELARAQRSSMLTAVLISHHTEDAFYEREEIATAIALARRPELAHRVVPIYATDDPSLIEKAPYGLRLKHGVSLSDAVTLEVVAQRLVDLSRPTPASRSTDDADNEGATAMGLKSLVERRLRELRIPLEITSTLRDEGLIGQDDYADFVKDLLRSTLIEGGKYE